MPDSTLVLGAGLAGLSAAHHLGGAVDVYEKEPFLGGHARTKRVAGFNFDEGAHVFFGKDEISREFVWEPLAGRMVPFRAEIWNNYGEQRIGRYPVQVNAHALPPEQATRCVLDFIAAQQQPDREVNTYAEWCRASLGDAFSEEFMFRYARKVWTVDPAELNTEWLGSKVGGRISRPSLEQVVRGAIDPNPLTLNYLTEFSYPSEGGFGAIAENLAHGLRNLRLGCGVERIEAAGRRITFTDGTTRRYDTAISTIPLPRLVRMTVDAPAEVRAAADRLLCTSVRCINLGVRRPEIGPGHWVYFYDHEIPFFRISFPSKFAPSNAPAGHSSVSCEIAYSRRKPLDEKNLLQRTIDALVRTGILEADDEIVVQDEMNIPYAYVVFDFQRQAALEVIHPWMESVGLIPCGRFGEWGYHWSFEAIESGKRAAARITSSAVRV